MTKFEFTNAYPSSRGFSLERVGDAVDGDVGSVEQCPGAGR